MTFQTKSTHRKIMSIQQQFPEQLKTLSTRHVILRIQQSLIVAKDLIVICF